MINVKLFCDKDGGLFGFNIFGHGNRLVCAAVSSAAYMTINTIEEVLNIHGDFRIFESGEMYVRIKENEEAHARDILKGFKIHLLNLEEQYPNEISVNYTEV